MYIQVNAMLFESDYGKKHYYVNPVIFSVAQVLFEVVGVSPGLAGF